MRRLDRRLAALRGAGRGGLARGAGLGALAIARMREEPDRLAVIDGARQVTRAELMDLACRLGGALLARGIGPGAAIGVQLPNWWEACVVNLAASLFGYRLAPLLTLHRRAELSAILPACEVEAVFAPRSFRGVDFPALLAGVEGHAARRVFTLRGEGAGDDAFETLLRHAPATPSPAGGDDLKLVLFTSGSTGRPKGVMHSHAAFDSLIRSTAAFWDVGPRDRLYVPSPIGHIGGSIYAFEFPWVTGCAAVLAESWSADAAVAEIERTRATFMAGATPFLAGLIAAARARGTRLPGLRRFVCGGASVPAELVREGLGAFPNAVVSRAYGSTEIPLVCPGVRTREEAFARADTDGECAVETRLIGEDGGDVVEGGTGEIAARAPQMMLGYLDPADEADGYTPDGFFRMGDLGRRVAGRYLEITGRKKDIIIRKGENISPLEIENALARHPAVRQACVVGAPDRERGEIVVAFVAPVVGAIFEFDEMRRHLEELGLARQKWPERLRLVSALPVNAVGKVAKHELRQRARMDAGQAR